MYKVEQQARDDGLTGQTKAVYRQEQSNPFLERFLACIDEQFGMQRFLPSTQFLSALTYVHERRVGLPVYLNDQVTAIDISQLEYAEQVIEMGKKNWLFS